MSLSISYLTVSTAKVIVTLTVLEDKTQEIQAF